MEGWRQFLEPEGDSRMRIKKRGQMLVDAVVIGDSKHVSDCDEKSLEQLTNSAALPGAVGELSLIHI